MGAVDDILNHAERNQQTGMTLQDEEIEEIADEIRRLRGLLRAAEANIDAVKKAVGLHTYIHRIDIS
jgi:hypothetical protein